MSTNGGAGLIVSGQTSPVQQQAMASQIAYNMQNGIPYDMHAQPGDPAAATIADAIMSQAQTLAAGAPAPDMGNQVGASTTGAGNGVSPEQQASIDAALAKYAPRVGQGGIDVPEALAPGGSVTSWLQSKAGDYGLVILGALLVLGALLISQRQNIQAAATTVAKVAVL